MCIRDRSNGKWRTRLSRFYFQDVVQPVTPAELEAAHHDGHATEHLEAGETTKALH